MTAVTVACVWVKANVPYSVMYVERLRSMVARHLDRPFRFVCLTDRPEQLPSTVEPIRVPSPNGLPGWWSKLRLFRGELGTGRILYLDLDCLVVSSLAPILDFPAAFATIPDPGSTFTPRTAHRVIKRFNSSVMVWDATGLATGASGQLYDAYDDWSPDVASRLWGDQDYLAERVDRGLLQVETMPAAWFPRLSQLQGNPPTADAKVVLCKVPKNEKAAQHHAWVREVWQ